MRLTLRTMLAYLDDILESPDAQELGQKIEESKFASDLVHRIRSSMRRLRLGAPKLEGKGMGLDPNTVAEYLDNTLRPEHVPDFEKVCLESDVHLAEVASCHQILTLVLGEPAEVEQPVRQRMYRIGRRPEEAENDRASTGAVAGQGGGDGRGTVTAEDRSGMRPTSDSASAIKGEGVTAAKNELPDYMRAGSRIPVKSLVVTLVLGFLITVVALLAMGPFGPQHPIWRFFVGGGETEVGEAPRQRSIEEGPVPPVPSEGLAASSAGPADVVSALPAPTDVALPTEEPAPAVGPKQAGGVASAEGPAPAEKPAEGPPAASTTAEGLERTSEKPPLEVPAERETGKPSPGEPATPVTVGRYISDEQVLARLDAETDTWFRLAPDSPLLTGDRLLTLPTYRPQLLLVPGLKVTFSDETSGHLSGYDADGAPTLSLNYGRAVVVPVGEPGAKLRLDLCGRQGWVAFGDVDSAMALEVRPYLAPGSDPESAAAQIVVLLFATSGRIRWSEGGQESVEVRAGQVLSFIDESPAQVFEAGRLPDWVESKHLTDIERRASRELRGHLSPDRPLSLSLMERTDFRQPEVRALACRSLCWLDVLEPIVKAFGDEQQHSYWDAHFEALQSALARNPASADKLRRTLEGQHGDDAEPIYRLLLGYSPEQLASGSARDLVAYLEHKAMCVRVLAYENLRRITGKTQGFRPERPPTQMKKEVVKWRGNLEEGQIAYKDPPSPLPPFAPVPREGGPEPTGKDCP